MSTDFRTSAGDNVVYVDSLNIAGVTVSNWRVTESLPGAFTGASNARGDHDGTSDPTTLFTVTGLVEVKVFGKVKTDLAGASATIEVGIAGNTAALLAQATGTDLDEGEVWTADGTTPISSAGVLPAASFVLDGTDIIETIATANLTGGEIEYYCIWRPLEADATVVAA